MTKEEILGMEAGPVLDALVAAKVMKWEVTYHNHKNGRDSDYSWISATAKDRYILIKPSKWQDSEAWNPSTDIKAALEVAEKMRDKGWIFNLKGWCKNQSESDGLYDASFNNLQKIYHVKDNLPEAICKAALFAVLEEKAEV